tara:strand:+ start:135 stop:353 length:219 start_codon:yes stop_codon:yes gene_type:complete
LILPGGADVDPEDVMRILDAANQDETDLQRNITSFEQREDDSSRLSVPPSPEIQIKVRSSPPVVTTGPCSFL